MINRRAFKILDRRTAGRWRQIATVAIGVTLGVLTGRYFIFQTAQGKERPPVVEAATATARTYLSFGQGVGTLQGQYLRSVAAPQRDPVTVCGWIRTVTPGPNVMSAFFGRDSGPGVVKEWSLFTAQDGSEISLEIQTPTGSSGLGANVSDPTGWHFVAMVRAGTKWTLYVDDQGPRYNIVTGVDQPSSAMSVGFVPGMFSGLLYSIADLSNWRVWEAALTGAELDAERLSVKPVRRANLWAWWPLGGKKSIRGLSVVSDAGTIPIQ